MFIELIVAGAILGYFLGILFIIPMVALMIFNLKYSDYFTVEFARTKAVELLLAISTKANINLPWLLERRQHTQKATMDSTVAPKIETVVWDFNAPLEIK